VPLRQALAEWLRTAELEDTTRRIYAGYIERTIHPAVGDVAIDRLTARTFHRRSGIVIAPSASAGTTARSMRATAAPCRSGTVKSTSPPSARQQPDATAAVARAPCPSVLLAALKGGGVAAADLQTSQLSINPPYAQDGRIDGYDVSNLVTATLRDLAGAGALVDAAAAAAGDAVRVQRLSFSIDDDSAARATARAAAVKQAQAQAKQMAEAAGVTLGPLRPITEIPATTPFAVPAATGDATASAPVPIEPGTQELNVNAEVAYTVAT